MATTNFLVPNNLKQEFPPSRKRRRYANVLKWACQARDPVDRKEVSRHVGRYTTRSVNIVLWIVRMSRLRPRIA